MSSMESSEFRYGISVNGQVLTTDGFKDGQRALHVARMLKQEDPESQVTVEVTFES